MSLLAIIVFGGFLVACILILPVVSGLTLVEKNKKTRVKETKTGSRKVEYTSNEYIPPDELAAMSEEEKKEFSLRAKASALKARMNVTSDDIPIQIRLKQAESADGLRKRHKERLDTDTDPNNYDYDLDDLIQEESEEIARLQNNDYYKNEQLGTTKEELV